MSSVYSLYSKQTLPVPVKAVWDFFSNPKNLLAVTPPALNLKVTNKLFGDDIYPGQVMRYTLKPLLGIPLAWMTEITHVMPQQFFVDEQREGPYKLWHHQHHFKKVEGGTEMIDLVHYQLPLGFIGKLGHTLVVKKQLIEIFSFRFEKIISIFGKWPGEKMVLEMD